MDWQEWIVGGIGVLVVVAIVRSVVRHFRSHGKCSSCASADCPLKKIKNKKS